MTDIATTSVGNGGWVRLGLDGSDAFVLVRFATDERNQLRAVETYIQGRINGDLLRALRIGELEGWANHPDTRRYIADRLGFPGPDLRRLASHWSASFNADHPRRADHWVAHSMWAQMEGKGVPQAPMGREPSLTSRQPRQEVHLKVPSARPYPDEFYAAVADAYRTFLAEGEPPGKRIAQAAGLDDDRITTAHRWIRRARTLGFLPEGTPGRAG